MSVASAIDKAREKLAAKAHKFRPGTCSIIKNTFVDGGSAGDTMGSSTGATGIPYKYKSAGHRSEIVVGGKAHTVSHWLTLPYTDDALAIKPEDRIVDDDDPTLIFQEPVIVPDSFSVFLNVAATLVHQGYR